MHFCSAGIQINSVLSSLQYLSATWPICQALRAACPGPVLHMFLQCEARSPSPEESVRNDLRALESVGCHFQRGRQGLAAQSAEPLCVDLQTDKLSLATRFLNMPGSPFHTVPFSNCKYLASVMERLHPWRIFSLKSQKIACSLFVTPTEILCKVLSGLLCGLLSHYSFSKCYVYAL